MTFCKVCGFKECHHIQTVLSASSDPLDKLAIIADKVSEVVGSSSTICAATTVPPPSQSSSCSVQPTMDSLGVSIEEVASATIIALIKSRPASVFHLVHLCKKTSKLCHSWNGRALETYQPVILLDHKSGQKFLIDSGSEICVIPPSPIMNKSPQSNFSLFAANNTNSSLCAYDRELLAIYSAIRHFRYMLEARDFTVFTDHKPLTYAFRQKRSDNIAADVLSRVSAITFPSQIDYDCIAETQQTDQELHTLIASGTSLELKKVTFPNSSTEIMCDLSTGTARPYIPKQLRQDVFSAMHNLSHPGIRRSVHLKQRFVWPSISSDVAKWADTA
ncbi:integrase catalytic domain-containing protein [Trichonephila clavipes]|nr:integrase catalytic domain-containing protein [Trichonephila clavipes]